MKKYALLILVFALLFAACGTEKSIPNHPENAETQASAERTMAETADYPEENSSGQPTVDDLEGTWILETVEIEGECLPADAEGIESTLVFYYNADGMLCADYTYGISWQEDSERVMLNVPVYQFAPESDTDVFFAWMDCSEYPYVFEDTQNEDYNLWFNEQGDLRLRFVSYTTGEYGVYSINYTYVRPEQPEDGIVLTADYTEEAWFEGYGADDYAIIAEIDSAEEMGTPIMIQTNTDIDSMKVVALAYNEETERLEVREELLEVGGLTPSDKLILRVAFPGTIPNRGLQITKDGTTKTFSLVISGYDGSLLLSELDPL